MTIDEARVILEHIQRTRLTQLRDAMFQAAIRYARMRTDWYLSTLEDRKSMDTSRSKAHDVFIDCCNILSRNMNKAGEDISWRAKLGDDRTTLGDFACYVHCLLGLRAG